MSQPVNIPSLFEACAAKVNTTYSTRATDPFSVFFDYGHYDAVNKNLVNKDGSITMKDKYPLIWLVTPFEQRHAVSQDYYCELSGLDILVLTSTDPDSSLADKVAGNFEPRLWPIVRELFKQIADSGLFQVLSEDAITYDYMKDWFYQSGLNGKNNLFNDTIDAVQIRNLRLRVNESVPEKFNLKQKQTKL